MSNFTIFILASIICLLFLWGFYYLVKKWPKFHITAFGKVLKIIYALVLLLAVAISFSWAYSSFEDYWEDDRLRIINEFRGVELGWSKDEVYFRKGEPTSVRDGKDKTIRLDYGDTVRTVLVLDKGKVIKILYVCSGDSYPYDKVGGISCYSDVDEVTKKYGEPKNISISKDKLSRIYSYPKYNVAFVLSMSKVDAIGVFDSTYVPEGLAFGQLLSTYYNEYNGPVVSGKPETNPTLRVSMPEVEDLEALYAQAAPVENKSKVVSGNPETNPTGLANRERQELEELRRIEALEAKAKGQASTDEK